MRLTNLQLQNFKGIETLDLSLDPHLNVLVGDNGSGKTAILEAITIAAGSLFLGMRNVKSRSILNTDVRYDDTQEYKYPVKISARADTELGIIEWTRTKNGYRGGTTSKDADAIKAYGTYLDKEVRQGNPVHLPLISYFSTARLFVQARTRAKKNNPESSAKPLASRFRGYYQSLDVRSNFRRFESWFRDNELARLQEQQQNPSYAGDPGFESVRAAIAGNLPDCHRIFYNVSTKTKFGLTVVFESGRTLPFEYLSDGMRNYIAMIADVAHRCVLLNPHYEGEALRKTKGIVLIDELDLHLHPSWQKAVVNSLLTTFPLIQFTITTHSPFLIQEAAQGQLIVLDNCKLGAVTGGDQLSLEDIAEYKQGVINPQWSTKKLALYEVASEYLGKLERGEPISEQEEALLDARLKPFGNNPAFDALLAQERLKHDHR